MHGFGKVILTKRPEKRVAWVIVFVAAWTLFTIQLTSVLTKYFEYSKKTTSEFVSGSAPFPAITLCNMQSFDFYTMHKFMKAIEGFGWGPNDSMAKFVGRNNSFAFYVGLLFDLFEKFQHDKNSAGEFNRKELYKMYSRTTITANLPDDVLQDIGVKPHEFIVACTFGNLQCNFTAIQDPYYIGCFKFEPPKTINTTSKEFQSLSEGIENGFSVTLFTGTKLMDTKFTKAWIPGVFEKGSPLSGSSGIRVVIHPPGTEPFPLTEGYDVPPGYLASLGIIPGRRKRLGRPYGYCSTRNRYEKDHIDDEANDSDQNEPYRKISCERMCMQEHVIEQCNCFEESLPDMGDTFCDANNICVHYEDGENETESSNDVEFESVDDDNDVMNDTQLKKSYIQTCKSVANFQKCVLQDDDSCNATVVADMLRRIRCADGVINSLMTDLTLLAKCKCYPPCDEYRYDVSYSLAKWPSNGYESGSVRYDIFDEENFLDRFSGEKREIYKNYVDRDGMTALMDFAKINVYVTDSDVLQTIEEPATVLTQLISEIGGQLGIWIGVSVITISEVIETVLTIATASCRKFYQKCKAKKTDSAVDPSTNSKGTAEK